eukprot:maker-scaffold1667_size31718-snap-gene-0.4 protein:Tk08330 transcript:maker-scaffold1667_size31718-snap-gene-0.4-mRNA-1 annotation:"hypothetical protein DAPPUDRAFT_311633"
MKLLLSVFICSLLFAMAQPQKTIISSSGQEDNGFLGKRSLEESPRDGKVLSLFQIVRFKNDPCISASRNGTCYTGNECTENGGVASGTCAGGYGVCCVFTLACGQTTRDNCTYLTRNNGGGGHGMAACHYTICKCSEQVCRIRLDFLNFDLAPPGLGTTVMGGVAISTNGGSIGDCLTDQFVITAPGNVSPPQICGFNTGQHSGSIGDCLTDQFVITAPGNVSPPQICGFNTGQHMIVDASDECHVASFNLARSTSAYDIKVTQYWCGDEMAGPDGCLQYFTGNMGTIASYNFPTQSNMVTPQITQYWCGDEMAGPDGCLQYFTGNMGTIASYNFPTQSNMIPGALRDSIIASAPMFVVGQTPDGEKHITRICGRYFNIATARQDRIDNLESICSFQRPFQVIFKTDMDEVTLAATNMPDVNEQSEAPGGITGFHLNWLLQDC